MVRDYDGGRQVVRPGIRHIPSAEQTLAEVLRRSGARPSVRAIAASHRVGVPDRRCPRWVAAVSADHRGVAFETCARLVDAVKERLPVEAPVLRRRHRRAGQLGLELEIHSARTATTRNRGRDYLGVNCNRSPDFRLFASQSIVRVRVEAR